MDNTRITITLEQRERAALMKLARGELREPRDQARYIIRRELEQLGLLPPADIGNAAQPSSSVNLRLAESDNG